MEQEVWNNGLCREFTKSVNDIIQTHQSTQNEYDLMQVGYEVTKLFDEMFINDRFL